MNELIELATLLDEAGYEIVDFHDELYEKEPWIMRSNQGKILKIIRVKTPKTEIVPS